MNNKHPDFKAANSGQIAVLATENILHSLQTRHYDQNCGTEVVVNGQSVVMMGAVNYLELSHHPRVVQTVVEAVRKHGAGGIGSRFSNGTLKFHLQLDHGLADFIGKESALMFNSGYMANLGVISTLPGRHAVIFTDKESHLSIYDACRLSGLRVYRYRHNDMEHLEALLHSNRHIETKWIASVGTFGVTGESVRLTEIAGLARKYGARIYLDDAHLIGVVGAKKRGLAESLNLLDEIDLIMGSFQMAFGNVGAFVAGPAELIDQLRARAKPYIFSYTLPAANAAALLETLSILRSREGDYLVERLWKNVARLRQGLKAHGFSIISEDSQITSVRVGDERCTAEFVDALAADGVWVQMYLHPSVPKGSGVVRLTCMATHSEAQIDRAIESMRMHRPRQLA